LECDEEGNSCDRNTCQDKRWLRKGGWKSPLKNLCLKDKEANEKRKEIRIWQFGNSSPL
jgi:hypothetical protein